MVLGPKILHTSCVAELVRRCPNFRPPEICALGGAGPPWRSWRDVKEDYLSCRNEFLWGTYIEIRLSYQLRHRLHHLLDGFVLPPSFFLCYDRSFCTRDEAVELLAPLWWLTTHRLMQNGRLDVHFWYMLDPMVEGFMLNGSSWAEQFLVEGEGLAKQIHKGAESEALASMTPSQQSVDVSGAICIVGQARTFHFSQVYTSLHHNLITALNFTEKAVVYILDLSASASFPYKSPPVELVDLAPALSLIPPTVLVTESVKFEGQNPNGTCPPLWPLGCNPQFKSLEMCMDQVRLLEQTRGNQFDWIVRVRPDMQIPFPLNDIRTYNDSVHVITRLSQFIVWDGFALVPRKHSEAYFSARQFGATEYCWLEHEIPHIEDGDGCVLRLALHLHARGVPIARSFPTDLCQMGVIRPAAYCSYIKSTGRDESTGREQVSEMDFEICERQAQMNLAFG